MKIVFGAFLDGYMPQRPRSSFGTAVLGPAGFLDVLETRLGVGQARVSHLTRVIQYLQCLEVADNGKRFYSASLAADGFAVASRLLGARDRLREAGWDGTPPAGGAGRPWDLAAVESQAVRLLAPGRAERLVAVLAALASGGCDISAVELVDPPELLSPAWSAILQRLPVLPKGPNTGSSMVRHSDLGRLQYALSNGASIRFQGDGTFFAATCDDADTLAALLVDALGDDMGAAPERWRVIGGADAVTWHAALRHRGLPGIGYERSRALSPGPQLLRLALDLCWEPLNPETLLLFLSHEPCPLPDALRSGLAAVVAEFPGIAGKHWNTVTARLAAEQGISIDSLDGLCGWLPAERHDPEHGAPIDCLRAVCRRLAEWGRSVSRERRDDHARALAALLEEAMATEHALCLLGANRSRLSRRELVRLLQLVGAEWPVFKGAVPDLGHTPLARHPGGCIEAAASVLWWDEAAPTPAEPLWWTSMERCQWAEAGLSAVDTDRFARALGAVRTRPVQLATERLIVALPRRRAGRVNRPSPLWDRLLGCSENGQLPTLCLEDRLDNGGMSDWLGVEPAEVAMRDLPAPRRWWHLNRDLLAAPSPRASSYSSLARFINAPHQWLPGYRARLRPGYFERFLQESRIRGSLVHGLLESIFGGDDAAWREVTQVDLARTVRARLASLLSSDAAIWLRPGRRLEVQRLARIAENATWQLVRQLRAAGVRHVAAEEALTGRFCGGDLLGRADLIVTNAAGREAVIDVKWGGAGYRCEQLREQRHLQLLLYARARGSVDGVWPAMAWFIFDEGRLFAPDTAFFPLATRCASSGAQGSVPLLWERFERTWQWRQAQLTAGRVEVVTSRTTPEDPEPPLPDAAFALEVPRDEFDEFRFLVGWEES